MIINAICHLKQLKKVCVCVSVCVTPCLYTHHTYAGILRGHKRALEPLEP